MIANLPKALTLKSSRLTFINEEHANYEETQKLVNDPKTMAHLGFLKKTEQGGWSVDDLRDRQSRRKSPAYFQQESL